MVTEIRNAANKDTLITAYRRRGYKITNIKTISRAGARRAGKYRVTYTKRK